MDFKREIPLPFYLGYEGGIWGQNRNEYEQVKQDFSYLQTVCPAKLREFQKRIEEMLNSLDFEGSMIYDQYPDKFSLSYLAKMITKGLLEGQEELPRLEDVIQVLVCDEIFKRRLEAGKKRYYGIQTGIGDIFGRETKNYYSQ